MNDFVSGRGSKRDAVGKAAECEAELRILYSPRNEVELCFIKSILNGENIPHFVHNDHYGSLEIGPRIDLLNVKTIMVGEEYFDRARDLVEDFLKKINSDSKTTGSKNSLLNKIRMIMEFLLFGWIMPGGKFRKNRKQTEKRLDTSMCESKKE